MRRGLSDSVAIAIVVAVALLIGLPLTVAAYNWTARGGVVPAPVVPVAHPLAAFKGQPLAADVGKAHRDFALVLAKHPITSTGALKAKLIEFHALLYAGENAGKLPGFSAAFDQAFTAAFGADEAPLDATKAKDFLEACATALGG